MSDPTLFRDGYTMRFRLKAVRGLHGELTGSYRPCTLIERDRAQAIARKGDPDKTAAVAIRLLTEKLVDWNATYHDEQGEPQEAPLTAYWIARLPTGLIDRLYWIVMGSDPGDPIEPDESQRCEESDREYLEALAGKDTAAADEGN